jgi:hypothetical protein
MSQPFRIFVALLLLAVAAGAIYFRGLHREVLRLSEPEPTEEQVRQALRRPVVAPPGAPKVKAEIFWASGAGGALEPVAVELPLAAEPVLRAKQLLHELISSPPAPERRTLPAGAVLLEFYLLEDGTAVADFSDSLSSALPAGILTEQAAVDSIVRTLEANVSEIRRLKILINGQETDTLAGHADLSEFFELRPAASPTAAELTRPQAPGKLRP